MAELRVEAREQGVERLSRAFGAVASAGLGLTGGSESSSSMVLCQRRLLVEQVTVSRAKCCVDGRFRRLELLPIVRTTCVVL